MAGLLPLFTLRLQHAYFAPALWRSRQLLPCARSAQRAQRAGVRLQPLDDGLAAWVEAERADALWRSAADAAAPWQLLLLLRPTDARYSLYSGIAGDAGCSTLLFDSAQASPADAQGWRWLHGGDAAGEAQRCNLGASALDDLDESEWLPTPAAVLRISLPLATAPLDDWLAGQAARRYALRLPARATRWTYLLPAEWAPQQPLVVDPDGQAEFDEPALVALADGRPALAVASRQPIAMSERPTQRFQLQARAPVADPVLVRRLPAASPELAHLATDPRPAAPGQPRALVSEIPVRR